jgi:hypothetical protein
MNIASVFYQPHFENATSRVLPLPNGGLMIDDSRLLEM